MNIKEIRNRLERIKGERSSIGKTINSIRLEIKECKRNLQRHEEAREIIREVGMKTQQQLQTHISDIASMAMDSVFPEPYTLQVEFVQRRNKTECDLYFERDGNRIDPMEASGFGAVDVAAIALRVGCWTMQTPRSQNILIQDEPFKYLKGEEPNKLVLEMIREISNKMGMQVIMVSDERISREEIMESADKVIEVTIRNKRSKVNEL